MHISRISWSFPLAAAFAAVSTGCYSYQPAIRPVLSPGASVQVAFDSPRAVALLPHDTGDSWPAQSDTSRTVRVGVRVRIDTATGTGAALARRFLGRTGTAGRVIDIKADSLAVRLDRPDTTVIFALAKVRRLEISLGRHSRLQDAGIGAAVGLGGGLAYLGLIDVMLGSWGDADAGHYARAALIGGAAGFASGLGFGGQERWKRIPVPRPTVIPGGGSAGIGLSVSVGF